MSLNGDIDDSIFNLEYSDAVPPLAKAARVGDLQAIKKLISKGNLPQAPDNRGWTAIHACVFANQLEALKLILKLKSKNKKYLVNLLTWENESPLIIALKSSKPSADMVNFLLESGADPNHHTHTKITALHEACMRNGNLMLVKLLVQFGANANAQEDLGSCTPLHFAVSDAHDLDIITYLINISDLKLVNANGRCAFLEACRLNFLEAVYAFIKKDKNLANVRSPKPPLLYACLWGNIKMAELLIDSGADVHFRCKATIFSRPGERDFSFDRNDFFPIHSSLNNIEVFTLLLKHTCPAQLLQLENRYYSFPLFVLMFGVSSRFYETLIQSEFPPELKIISCRVLIHFTLSYPLDMDHYVMKAFPLLFKYNFYFEPENVFQEFVCQLSSEEVCMNFKIFHALAQMGISSEDEFENKRSVIRIFENHMLKNDSPETSQDKLDTFKSICDLLSEPVLTLKQYCRIAVRRGVKSKLKSAQKELPMAPLKMSCERRVNAHRERRQKTRQRVPATERKVVIPEVKKEDVAPALKAEVAMPEIKKEIVTTEKEAWTPTVKQEIVTSNGEQEVAMTQVKAEVVTLATENETLTAAVKPEIVTLDDDQQVVTPKNNLSFMKPVIKKETVASTVTVQPHEKIAGKKVLRSHSCIAAYVPPKIGESKRIAIRPKDFPRVVLDEKQMQLIQEDLLRKVLTQKNKKAKYGFHGITTSGGYLMLHCACPKTANWLKSLRKEIDQIKGVRLEIVDDVLPTSKFTASMIFPDGENESTERILSFIQAQNRKLCTCHWNVVQRTDTKEGVHIKFSMDHSSFARLKRNSRINYKWGSIGYMLDEEPCIDETHSKNPKRKMLEQNNCRKKRKGAGNAQTGWMKPFYNPWGEGPSQGKPVRNFSENFNQGWYFQNFQAEPQNPAYFYERHMYNKGSSRIGDVGNIKTEKFDNENENGGNIKTEKFDNENENGGNIKTEKLDCNFEGA